MPVRKLALELGCKFQWDGDDCTQEHPVRGRVEVVVVNACADVLAVEERKKVNTTS